MQIWLEVENFAKIERAKICLGSYILFVGQNNSGKTFLMQLIQGILKKFTDLMDERTFSVLLDEDENAYVSYIISSDNISQFVDRLNKRLLAEKEMLVKEIFQREIPIGRLSIDLRLEEDVAYKIVLLNQQEISGKQLDKIVDQKFLANGFSLPYFESDYFVLGITNRINIKNGTSETVSFYVPHSGMRDPQEVLRWGMGTILECNSLFLPASRAGLLLLYRDFFLNKADHVFSYNMGKNQALKNNQDYGGLTKPTYEFLRFLQRFTENEPRREAVNEELRFFENNLIEGHISVDEQKVFSYRAKNDENEVPMYLASSLINEVAPLAMAITGGVVYDWLIIDEIESSVHPEKQGELVRFLNRLNRKGEKRERTKLIISTHSDTFVSKVNNLYILSCRYQRSREDGLVVRNDPGAGTGSRITGDSDAVVAVLNDLHLSPEDLVDPTGLSVYEFVMQDNGKSIVKEVHGNEKTGFQFDLFASSAMKLYAEALKIGESLE